MEHYGAHDSYHDPYDYNHDQLGHDQHAADDWDDNGEPEHEMNYDEGWGDHDYGDYEDMPDHDADHHMPDHDADHHMPMDEEYPDDGEAWDPEGQDQGQDDWDQDHYDPHDPGMVTDEPNDYDPQHEPDDHSNTQPPDDSQHPPPPDNSQHPPPNNSQPPPPSNPQPPPPNNPQPPEQGSQDNQHDHNEPDHAGQQGAKRGVGLSDNYKGQAVTQFGSLSWCFSWNLNPPSDLPPNMQFIPCIWGQNMVGQAADALTKLQSQAHGHELAITGFNEPDGGDQSHMDPGTAKSLWESQVMPLKQKFQDLKLGSPAVTSSTNAGQGKSWLNAFFGGAQGDALHEAAKHMCDVLTVHWYGTDINAFKQYIQDMHTTYGLPIWINEFACTNYSKTNQFPSQQDVTNFMNEALQWLDGEAQFVEKYAYFGNGHPQDLQAVGMNNSFCTSPGEGSLTALGHTYTNGGGAQQGQGQPQGQGQGDGDHH